MSEENYQLKDDEAAIIFSKDGVRCAVPKVGDDEIVPEEALAAVCCYVLLTKYREEIQLRLDQIMNEIMNETNEEDETDE